MDFSFIHASDLHLDSPFLGLKKYERAPIERMRDSTRRALENLVALAIQKQVNFLLLSGDLYDGDLTDYNTALFLQSQFAKLKSHQIPCYLVLGNHDAQTRITKKLSLPSNVTVFSAKRPQTHLIKELKVAIHGQSYLHSATKDNLSLNYPVAKENYFNIGLLHTALAGRKGHEPYAPASLDDLKNKSYDYWALGHVHNKEIVNTNPWIVFSGCTQGRHIREQGAKGCFLVKVIDNQIKDPIFQVLDNVRWAVCEIPAENLASPEQVVSLVGQKAQEQATLAENRVLALRVEINGQSKAHDSFMQDQERWENEIRSCVADATGESAWVEKIKFNTWSAKSLEKLASENTAIGDLVEFLNNIKDNHDQEALDFLIKEITPLADKLPQELTKQPYGLDFKDPHVIQEKIKLASELLLHKLSQARGNNI